MPLQVFLCKVLYDKKKKQQRLFNCRCTYIFFKRPFVLILKILGMHVLVIFVLGIAVCIIYMMKKLLFNQSISLSEVSFLLAI